MILRKKRLYLIVTVAIFVAGLIAGLGGGPVNIPVVRWFHGLGLNRSRILVAVDVEGNVSQPVKPVALLSLAGKGVQGNHIMGNMLMALGLVDPPAPRQTSHPRTLAVMDLDGNSVRELGYTRQRWGSDWRVWLSSNGRRVVWVTDTGIFTCVLPHGEIERPDYLNSFGINLDSPLACRMSSDGGAAVLAYVGPVGEVRETGPLPVIIKWVDFRTGRSQLYGSFHAPRVVDGDVVADDWLDLVSDISTDGSRVVVAGSQDPATTSSIFLLEPATDGITLLTGQAGFNDYCPAFTPSGDAICFVRMPEYSVDMTAIDTEGGCLKTHTDATVVYLYLADKSETTLANCSYSCDQCLGMCDCFPSLLVARKSDSDRPTMMILDCQNRTAEGLQSRLGLAMRAGILAEHPPAFEEYGTRTGLWSDSFSGFQYLGIIDGALLLQGIEYPSSWTSWRVSVPVKYVWITRIPERNYRLGYELYPAPGKILAWSGQYGGRRRGSN